MPRSVSGIVAVMLTPFTDEGEVDYASGNTLTVTFSSAFSGKAYLS